MTCNVITDVANNLSEALTPDLSALESAVQNIWSSIENNMATGIDSDEAYDIASTVLNDLDINDYSSQIEDMIREVISEDDLLDDAIKTALPSVLGDCLSGPGKEEFDGVCTARDNHYRSSDWKGVVLYKCRLAIEGISNDIQEWLDGGTTDLAHVNVIEVLERIKCVVDALENTPVNNISDQSEERFARIANLNTRLEWTATKTEDDSDAS